jgi:Protein of unknown function (DUF2934)
MKKEKRMSSEAARNESTEADASAPEEEIRGRAYEIYLERGGQQGGDLDDWVQAERELVRGVLWREQAG